MTAYTMFLGAAGVVNSDPIVASGGTETIVGNYKYHTFNSSGTFTVTTVPSGRDLSYMIAGGGGGGGAINDPTGGGGAGGFRWGNLSPSVTSYTITIGAGGAKSTTAASGSKGSDSSAFSVTALAGGGGGWNGAIGNANNNGASGGGGGGGDPTQVGQGTTGQGFGGWQGSSDKSGSWGGGGGGCTSPGGYVGWTFQAVYKYESFGGRGVLWFDDATGYCGGGYSSEVYPTQPPIALPSYGAGWRGSDSTGNAAANRGGGGSGYYGTAAGNGGSGVVIIKYPIYGIMFEADVLIVGGGGAGGGSPGSTGAVTGGGGAGGYVPITSHTLTSGVTYTVTIGAGQATASQSSAPNSSFDGWVAIGGGTGGTFNGPGRNSMGGSSGGTFEANSAATFVLDGCILQGNKGGVGYAQKSGSTYFSNSGGGGGGGASAAGAASTTSLAGVGGAGTTWVDGNTYAGGGGGGANGSISANSGGAGGGGAGGKAANGTSGTANTGGGGGGTGKTSNAQTFTGGNGGSGVVIIRYANTLPDAASTTGSPTYTNSGGYKTYKFTGSGTITW